MIIKSYEVNKVNIKDYDIFLFYGKNEGLQNEIIEKNLQINKDIKFF